jgi:transcriptional regulator with XRE-family HTH domain
MKGSNMAHPELGGISDTPIPAQEPSRHGIRKDDKPIVEPTAESLQPPNNSDGYRREVWRIRQMMRELRRPIPGDGAEHMQGIDWHSKRWPESLEELDDPRRPEMEYLKFMERRHKMKAERFPTAKELFDLVDQPGWVRPGQRLKISRLMAQVPQSRIAMDLGMKTPNTMISQWETGEKNIAEDKFDKLAKSICVKTDYLRSGERPFPSWLDPWLSAVRALSDMGCWMAHLGVPPPYTRNCPPGPFPHVLIGWKNEESKEWITEKIPKHSETIFRPLNYAIEFIYRLDEYLGSIHEDGEVAWLSKYQEMVEYLPFLPYVWHRLGLLVYAGKWPATRRAKSCKKVKP